MSRVPAIHHPLRQVNSTASHVAIGIDIRNAVNRSGVGAHADLYMWICAQSPADFNRAACRGFWVAEEYKSHAVTARQSHQTFVACGLLNVLSVAHQLLQQA